MSVLTVNDLADRLRALGWHLATAESCTGARSSAPCTIARATSSLTAPCAAISAIGTPSSSALASLL